MTDNSLDVFVEDRRDDGVEAVLDAALDRRGVSSVTVAPTCHQPA